MKILYNLASRSRPQRLFETLDNIYSLKSAEGEYSVLLKLDLDDITCNNKDIRQRLEGYQNLSVAWGESASKIHAINRHINAEGHDIIVNVSDDQRFLVHGFDDIIREDFKDSGVHFLHYPDSFAQSRVSTMNITTTSYYLRRGFIYHPDYYSLWCDEEETGVAKILGVYKLCDKKIFDHWHYSQRGDKKIFKDALYQRNDTYRRDEKIFNQRKAQNFYLNDLVNINMHDPAKVVNVHEAKG